MDKNKILAQFQKLGKVLMTPVLILPVAGILVGVSTALTNAKLIEAVPFLGNSWLLLIFALLKDVGNVVIGNLPVLFAICTAYGYAKSEKGTAALNGFLSFMVINVVMGSLLKSLGVIDSTALKTGQSSILGIITLDTGVFGGIIAGLFVSFIHNKYYKIELPSAFAFFNGTRFIPIVNILGSICIGLILAFIFPPIQSALGSLALFIKSTGALGAFVYGLTERLLLPFGMHLLIVVPLMFTPMGGSQMVAGTLVEGPLAAYNAVLNTPGAMFSVDISRFVMNGKILMAFFGYTAIAYAFYKTSYLKNKPKTKALMIATIIPCVLTGISEPIEFAFIFISPLLYVFHSFMSGLAYLLMYIFNFNVAGSTAFGGPILSMIFNGIMNADKGTNWYIVFLVGIPYFLIYYFVFKTIIERKYLQTPGREMDNIDSSLEISEDAFLNTLIEAIGGLNNIKTCDACFTRLRLTLNDNDLLKPDNYFTDTLDAKGVVHVGDGVQIIYGAKAELYKTSINERMEH